MKRWAKVLLVIGLVWLIAIVAYFVFACPIYKTTPLCTSEIMDANSGACPDYGLGNPCLEFWPFVTGVLVFGIPSWIIFVIIAIWGRGKKNKY